MLQLTREQKARRILQAVDCSFAEALVLADERDAWEAKDLDPRSGGNADWQDPDGEETHP